VQKRAIGDLVREATDALVTADSALAAVPGLRVIHPAELDIATMPP
jgi:hypothetical protein